MDSGRISTPMGPPVSARALGAPSGVGGKQEQPPPPTGQIPGLIMDQVQVPDPHSNSFCVQARSNSESDQNSAQHKDVWGKGVLFMLVEYLKPPGSTPGRVDIFMTPPFVPGTHC